jgi:hypothetical protein
VGKAESEAEEIMMWFVLGKIGLRATTTDCLSSPIHSVFNFVLAAFFLISSITQPLRPQVPAPSWRDFSARWRRPAFDRKAAIDALVEKIDELARLTSDPSDPGNNLFRDTAPARTLSENVCAAERTRQRDCDGLEATFALFASDGQYERFRDPRKGKAQYSQQVKRDDILALHGELLAAHRRVREQRQLGSCRPTAG